MRISKKLIINFFLLSLILNTQANAREKDKTKDVNCVTPVLVAVIDTGIDSKHPKLADYLWKDPNSPTVFGWDFNYRKLTGQMENNLNNSINSSSYIVDLNRTIESQGTPNPNDNHGHGTHISGIILSHSHCARIMSIKYYSDSNSGPTNLRNTVKAIKYAIKNKARIINYSGGGPESDENELLALKEAESQGILVVAAAGNEHQNVDLPSNEYYPAGYRLKNIITVASVDSNDNLVLSSNWGKNKVDIAAPGENITSTLPNNREGTMSGTSQATAQVSGIAASIWGKNPSLTVKEVKQIIFKTASVCPKLKNKIATGGIVNGDLAIQKVKKFQSKKVRKPAKVIKEYNNSEDRKNIKLLLKQLQNQGLYIEEAN